MKRLRAEGLVGLLFVLQASAIAQDFGVLRINEVIAHNHIQPPADVRGSYVDMVEIYNTGPDVLSLGGSTSEDTALALSNTAVLPAPELLWTFPQSLRIQPGGNIGAHVIVFCDGNTMPDGLCEPHTSFQIASDGSEPITLWGPVVGADGQGKPTREIIDQVWLPPLPADVSFGRFPDGAGPAPVPLEDVLDVFVFHPAGSITFGSCFDLPMTVCPSGRKRVCPGAANMAGGNIEPRVELESHSTNAPEAGEAVDLVAELKDDKDPLPPNIARVEIVYRVDKGTPQIVPMTLDTALGVQHEPLLDEFGNAIGENPFNVYTHWQGRIPGQAAGSVVEFHVRAADLEGLEDTSPEPLCALGIGPCDREFGGPGCSRDLTDTTCSNPSFTGVRYIACDDWFRYTVGYEPSGPVAHLVINEIMASQTRVFADPSEAARVCGDGTPACKFDDFIELYNDSDESVDLAGISLSSSAFRPSKWTFPEGAVILGREHLIVWVDGDGGRCPDPSLPAVEQPCFWSCLDPTDVGLREYHVSFTLDASANQIWLFDRESAGRGRIHGTKFRDRIVNHSLSLIPDGDPTGCWVDCALAATPPAPPPTPGQPNTGECPGPPGPKFLRGDANSDCLIDITDVVFTLNYLFQGGNAPLCHDAADVDDNGAMEITDPIGVLNYLFLGGPGPREPGPFVSGPDPTPDELGVCIEQCAP